MKQYSNGNTTQDIETQMDEFEITSKTTKNNPKNILKKVKIAGAAVVMLFLSATVIIAINMLSQAQKEQIQKQPITSVAQTASPTTTPHMQYPKEFTIIENKIEDYEKEVLKAQSQNERNKLNYPLMTISFSF